MKRSLVAQQLLEQLNEKINKQHKVKKTVILGVVLKGLPIAYGIARMNKAVQNFVPLVAQRHMYLQHEIESYFPSSEWITYFSKLVKTTERILIVDDVVNTGFTRQKVEGIAHSIMQALEVVVPLSFAALVLNKKRLANSSFVHQGDIFSLEVNASDVECDWGLMTVPLWGLTVKETRLRCEEYYQTYWSKEKRFINIIY